MPRESIWHTCGERKTKVSCSKVQCENACGAANAKVSLVRCSARVSCSEEQCEGTCEASSAKVDLVRPSAEVLDKLVAKAMQRRTALRRSLIFLRRRQCEGK